MLDASVDRSLRASSGLVFRKECPVMTCQMKGCGILPAEPCILPTLNYRCVQDLDIGPWPLPLAVLSPIRLWIVRHQIEYCIAPANSAFMHRVAAQTRILGQFTPKTP